MASGAELMFCAHHGREYEAGLRAVEADVTWESDRQGEALLENSHEG
jgi:hypothetical protein